MIPTFDNRIPFKAIGFLATTLALGLLSPGRAAGEDQTAPERKSRLTLSPRVGFNLSATFEGLGQGTAGRITPNGDSYNYDDGYVLLDSSGNLGGQTWYWGYDNSAAQVSGDNILLSRTLVSSTPAAESESVDPAVGAELVYDLELGTDGRLRYGFKAGVGYQRLHVQSAGNQIVTLTTLADRYPFTPGATPPSASPGSPYQGTYQGPSFLIGDTPSGSSATVLPDVPVSSENELTADLWTVRMGPALEYPLGNAWTVGLDIGIEAGFLNPTISWSDSGGAYRSVGEVTDSAVLVGFYAGAAVAWHFTERWSLLGGLQYHNLGTYAHDYGERTVKLNLDNAIYGSIGVAWDF